MSIEKAIKAYIKFSIQNLIILAGFILIIIGIITSEVVLGIPLVFAGIVLVFVGLGVQKYLPKRFR